MRRSKILTGAAACLMLTLPAAQAGDGRWNAVEGWMRKVSPDANVSRTIQHGDGNGSSTVQLGGGNLSVIHQKGNDNAAQAVQTGNRNISTIIQLGNSNAAVVEQSGHGNLSRSIQIGDGHDLARRQHGGERASNVQAHDRNRKETRRLVRRLDKTAWRSVKQVVKDFR